jgi:hypothetical protein
MRSISRYWNPVLAWTDLAWKMTEMSVASASVIHHRTNRMATAGRVPSGRDRKEFARMGSEKVAAGMHVAVALSRHGLASYVDHSARTFAHMVEATTALMTLAASQNPNQFLARQPRLARSLSRLTESALALSDSAARMAAAGLAPVHSRAVANAKRLARR